MKLVIIDRDGTINEDRDDYVKSHEEWVPIPGSLEALVRLHQAGWHVVIATNQSGLGRGLFDMATLNAMHQKMAEMLARMGGRIDAIFFCPHAPEENCDCRKPRPGLFHQIAQRYGIELAGVPSVGDTLRDVQAGHAAGCAPHLVLTGKSVALSEQDLQHMHGLVPGLKVHADLSAFVEDLLAGEQRRVAEARLDARR